MLRKAYKRDHVLRWARAIQTSPEHTAASHIHTHVNGQSCVSFTVHYTHREREMMMMMMMMMMMLPTGTNNIPKASVSKALTVHGEQIVSVPLLLKHPPSANFPTAHVEHAAHVRSVLSICTTKGRIAQHGQKQNTDTTGSIAWNRSLL